MQLIDSDVFVGVGEARGRERSDCVAWCSRSCLIGDERPCCKVGLRTPRKRMCRRRKAAGRIQLFSRRFDVPSPAKMQKMKLAMSGPGASRCTIDEPRFGRGDISVDAVDCIARSGMGCPASTGVWGRHCIIATSAPTMTAACTHCNPARAHAPWPRKTPLLRLRDYRLARFAISRGGSARSGLCTRLDTPAHPPSLSQLHALLRSLPLRYHPSSVLPRSDSDGS